MMETSRRVRFDGTINLGHCLTILTIAFGVIVFGLQLQAKNALQDSDITAIKERMAWESENVQRSLSRIETTMQRIETKLDTKADKP